MVTVQAHCKALTTAKYIGNMKTWGGVKAGKGG